jgi:hypothetical protein
VVGARDVGARLTRRGPRRTGELRLRLRVQLLSGPSAQEEPRALVRRMRELGYAKGIGPSADELGSAFLEYSNPGILLPAAHTLTLLGFIALLVCAIVKSA